MIDIESKLLSLYKRIFGDKIQKIDYEKNPKETLNPNKIFNKCEICKTTCKSYKFRQDLPYFKNIHNIETFVIGESPGSGEENGKLGYVFGWNQFSTREYSHLNIKKYRNYFFNVLNLNEDNTYITDAIKCYTHKNDFNEVFINCQSYLREEILILKPKNILIISKQNKLKKFLQELNKELNFNLKIIPHPSNQNFSKIKTVSDIFKSLGEIENNQKWIDLSKSIENEYSEINNKLKA